MLRRYGSKVTVIVPRPVRGQDLSVRVRRPSDRRSLSRSATRALDVLEFFGNVRRPLRAVEIAVALGLHASTANQLLKTMVDSAHLIFDARDKTYQPSPRLVDFGGWLAATYGGSPALRSLLQDVRERTAMIVTVSTANDLFMQIIDLEVPPGSAGERGLRISLFGSAIGSAYLSMLADGEVQRLAARARIPAAQLPAIAADLARIRAAGSADGGTSDQSFWSLALPLPAGVMPVPTVLGLSGAPDQVRPRLDELRRTMTEAIGRWRGAAGEPA